MDTKRIEKINRLIQKDLAEIFRQKSNSELFGAIISVTKVAISTDLSIARVYLSAFVPGDKYSTAQIVELISQKKDMFRLLLGQKERYQLRAIPQLNFFEDDTLEQAKRIDLLLKKQ